MGAYEEIKARVMRDMIKEADQEDQPFLAEGGPSPRDEYLQMAARDNGIPVQQVTHKQRTAAKVKHYRDRYYVKIPVDMVPSTQEPKLELEGDFPWDL